ncbi:MAG TPA: J domain-containing protein [Burkholderiales bacterium]
MEDSTDLYAILGVLPNADEVVIRAAYRALSQRYRPDRSPGDPAEAAARLKRVEEAYTTLSDPARRSEYDQRASADTGSAEFGEQAPPENVLDVPGWRADWDLVCRFYPPLRDVESQFRAISPALAFTFCATLLETKRFPDADGIARQMEQAYLSKYFGDDPDILAFAKRLIVGGNAEAVHTLSRALQVLGSSTPASLIIETLSRELDATPAEAAADEYQDFQADAGEPDTIEVEPEDSDPGDEVSEAEPDEEPADSPPPEVEEAAEEEPGEPAEEAEAEPEVEEPIETEPPPPPVSAHRPAAHAASSPAKLVIKDPKKRASVQSFLRAYRAGEGLDLDSAVTLVRAMEGTVNLKKADAQFGDTQVEVRFRGRNIMFSSGEFVEWVQRKILPEALGKM